MRESLKKPPILRTLLVALVCLVCVAFGMFWAQVIEWRIVTEDQGWVRARALEAQVTALQNELGALKREPRQVVEARLRAEGLPIPAPVAPGQTSIEVAKKPCPSPPGITSPSMAATAKSSR